MSWLGEVLELMGTALDAPGSPFWELETAIRDSELSGNLAHELLPLPGPVVTLFHSTHLPSLEGSRRRTAALWVSAVAESVQFIYFALAGSETVCRGFLPLLTFPKLKNLVFDRVVGFHPPLSGVVLLECGPCSWTTQAWLLQNWPCCSPWLVSRDSMVDPAWARKEHTKVLPVARFSDGEHLSDLGCTLCHPVARLSGKAYQRRGLLSGVGSPPVGGILGAC